LLETATTILAISLVDIGWHLVPSFFLFMMKQSQKARLKLRCPIVLGREPYIAIPDGWFDLVYEMCAKLEDIAQQINQKHRQRLFLPRIITISVESGKLSCDVINRNKDINDLLRKVRMHSAKRCMICGEEAHQFRDSGELVSRCEAHRAESSANY
jgi:hypothetical protein